MTEEEALELARAVKLPLPVVAAAGKGEVWAIEEFGMRCVLAGARAIGDTE